MTHALLELSQVEHKRHLEDSEFFPSKAMLKERLLKLREWMRETPLRRGDRLPHGIDLLVKYETSHDTGSFKQRGAMSAMLVAQESGVTDVFTYSAGNHAAGVAFAARRLDMNAHVYMAATAGNERVEHVQNIGGPNVTVSRHGSSLEDAKNKCEDMCVAYDGEIIAPYDDLDVIYGQSSVLTETFEQCLEAKVALPDAVFVPIGGGGLAAGSAMAIHAYTLDTKLVIVQAEGNDSLSRSLEAGKLMPASNRNSVCAGTNVESIGELNFQILFEHYKNGRIEVISVTNADIGKLLERETLQRQELLPVMGDDAWLEFPETTGLLAAAGAEAYAKDHPEDSGKRYLSVQTGSLVDERAEQVALSAWDTLRRGTAQKCGRQMLIAHGLHTRHDNQ